VTLFGFGQVDARMRGLLDVWGDDGMVLLGDDMGL
jgi:hypothetical protein